MDSGGGRKRRVRCWAPAGDNAERTDELLHATSEGGEAIVFTEGLPIARRDVASLRDRGWLTDDVINAFLQVITRGSLCLALSSFLYTKLESGGDAARWVKGAITGYAKILLPIHQGAHWTLAIIEPGADLIRHYDPLKGCSKGSAVHSILEQWFCDRARKVGGLRHACSAHPPQQNGYDCGVFVCMRALYEVRGARPMFKQADMPLCRRIIAQTILIHIPDALKTHVKLSDAVIDPHADALLAASGGDTSEVMVSHGEAVLRSDLHSLLPNGWLTSVVINAFMRHLHNLQVADCFFLSTHFFQRLTQPSYSYSRVRRWVKAADIDRDKVILPVNYADVHWTLVVIEPRVRRVTHYDPLGIHAQQLRHDVTRCVADMPWGPDNSTWKQVRSSTPRQHSTDDSGVFICMRALYETLGSPGFTQSDVLHARRAIAQAVVSNISAKRRSGSTQKTIHR